MLGTNIKQPFKGLLLGSIIYLAIAVICAIVFGLAFRRSGKGCYAVNFSTILIFMAYVLWACTYMSQMFPEFAPTKEG